MLGFKLKFKVGTYVVVDMFGLPADTIKDEFRTKVPVERDIVDAAGEHFEVNNDCAGGSSKWIEPKLWRGPIYLQKGKSQVKLGVL